MFVPFLSFHTHSRHYSLFKEMSQAFGSLTVLTQMLSNRLRENGFCFQLCTGGIRGAQRSPEGLRGRAGRDTRFPWQPDWMEPLKLCHVMFEMSRKGLCDYLLLLSISTMQQHFGFFLLFLSFYLCKVNNTFILIIRQLNNVSDLVHVHSRLAAHICVVTVCNICTYLHSIQLLQNNF